MDSNTHASTHANANAERVIAATIELALCCGSLAKASRRLGRRRNYFSRVRERGAMEWGSYFATLEMLDVDHLRATRWAHAVAEYPALEQFGARALVTALKSEPPLVRSTRLAYLQGHLDENPLGTAESAFLEELNGLRLDDPSRAAERAERALAETTSGLLAARLLGVWASSLRLEHRLDAAQVTLWTALRIAATSGSCAESLGDLIQRCVYVVGDLGHYEQAVALADTACTHYEAAQRPDLVGRALVDRGVALYDAGVYEEVPAALERALRLVAPDDRSYRCAAFHLLGDIEARSGRLDRATGLLEAALAEAASNRPTLGRLHWLLARIAVAQGQDQIASYQYAQAADSLGLAAPVDTALVAAEHTRLLIRRGETARAGQLASAMRWAVIPLEEQSPQAAAALADLIVASEEAVSG